MNQTTERTQWFVPCGPLGMEYPWLKARTEAEAWSNILKGTRHMPSLDKEALVERGYTVEPFVLEEGHG